MPPDGVESLALWREAGEWWSSGPQREVHRFIDDKGIRRESVLELPSLSQPSEAPNEQIVQISQARRVSHDKVALACGMVHMPQLTRFVPPPSKIAFATLHTLSGYAFGRSAMIAATIPALVAKRGSSAALIADPFSLTGAAEFVQTADQVGIHPLVGASFEMEEGGELVLIARMIGILVAGTRDRACRGCVRLGHRPGTKEAG